MCYTYVSLHTVPAAYIAVDVESKMLSIWNCMPLTVANTAADFVGTVFQRLQIQHLLSSLVLCTVLPELFRVSSQDCSETSTPKCVFVAARARSTSPLYV